MHRTYIADIERGARNVTLRTLASLATALAVPVEKLVLGATASLASPFRSGLKLMPATAGEILLVEDSATDAALTVRTLKRANLTNRIRIVCDGEDGLHYLRGSGLYAKRPPAAPQLILLDLNLPGMSGLDFLRGIKADERTKGIQVVVLTASRRELPLSDSGWQGAEHVLIKPLTFAGLVRVIPDLNLFLTIVALPSDGPKVA